MKKLFFIIFILILMKESAVLAVDDYVLPYPGPMPGNKLYKISSFVDKLQKYWNWGSLASIHYHQSLSDKYIVEAKTLWDYKQYLLGTDALNRSNDQVKQIPKYIKQSFLEGKDINFLVKVLAAQTEKHIEVLSSLRAEVPSEVNWKPEKEQSQLLKLQEMIDNAINERKEVLIDVASFTYCTQMISSQKTKQELSNACKDAKSFVNESMYQEILK